MTWAYRRALTYLLGSSPAVRDLGPHGDDDTDATVSRML